MDNSLIDALYASGNEYLDIYLEITDTNIIKEDIKALIHCQSDIDLKAFTMAAMQGLCANSAFNGPVGADQTPEGILAQVALRIALATLAELSKHH